MGSETTPNFRRVAGQLRANATLIALGLAMPWVFALPALKLALGWF